jgi:hypothetical protein
MAGIALTGDAVAFGVPVGVTSGADVVGFGVAVSAAGDGVTVSDVCGADVVVGMVGW